MANPTNPKDTSGCTDKMDASCIAWNGPAIDCLTICKGDSLEDVVVKEGKLLCNIVSDLNTLENPPTPPIIDFSSLDLKCLWTATITQWNCPCAGLFGQPKQYFYPDISAPGGAGYCGSDPKGPSPVLTSCIPVSTIIANPVPRPNTLLGILQLILNKIPCCNPCATIKFCCEVPYIWLDPASTGNPSLYPNGACAQNSSPSTIVPFIVPFKC